MAPAQSWDLGGIPPTPWDGASLTQRLDPVQQCPFKYKSEPLSFYKVYPSGRSQVPRESVQQPGPLRQEALHQMRCLWQIIICKGNPQHTRVQEGELRLGGFHLSTDAQPISKRKAILGSGAGGWKGMEDSDRGCWGLLLDNPQSSQGSLSVQPEIDQGFSTLA